MPLLAFVRSEIEQAAERNGFPVDTVEQGDWLLLRSPFTRHQLLATHDGTRFLVATASEAIAEDAGRDWPTMDGAAPAGMVRTFAAGSPGDLHRLVQRLYRLAVSLPPEPLREFEDRTAGLPYSTEAERLVIQRVGQGIFRQSLMEYWGGRCPLTGIDQPELLRASHIKPWAECETDAKRLDVHNGLLLAAHLDAAFDAFLISFSDEGALLVSPRLGETERKVLSLDDLPALIGLRDRHKPYLAFHRARMADSSRPE
jgi:putative restriction endonuclease